MKNTNFGWDNKKLFLIHWKSVFLVTDKFFKKWTFPKIAIFCPKNAFFFDKIDKFTPWTAWDSAGVKEYFFPLAFFYLNSKEIFGVSWGTWWKPPLNIFNLAKNGPFLKDLRKKVSKSDWNHIHKLHDTQTHHNTWFLTTFLLKMPQF